MGYVLRRLVAKWANSHVIAGSCQVLQPTQVDVGAAGEAEVAINAMRRRVKQLLAGHAVAKPDFRNAFNSIIAHVF